MARQWGLDILRIISMAAVVFIHAAAQFWSLTDVHSSDWMAMNAYDSAVRWAVPVFVMISGALFLRPDCSQSIRRLYSKNIVRIVIVILVWGFVYALFYHFPEDISVKSLWAFIKACLLGHFHMWFLFMIIGLYIVTPVLRCVTRDAVATRYFLIVAFICNSLLPFITGFGHFSILDSLYTRGMISVPLGYSFYFVLGFWLNQHDFGKCRVGLSLAAIVLGYVMVFGLTCWASFDAGRGDTRFYDFFSLPVLLESVGVFVLVRGANVRSIRGRKVVSVMSGASLGVYLVHMLVMDALRNWFGLSTVAFNSVLAIPVTAISVIGISFVLAVALRKIPVVGKYIV